MYLGVHLIVSGRVQGVCYRAGTYDQALQLRLFGWAKNCRNGTVEVYAEGKKENLEKLVLWCREGSSEAQVTSLDINWVESQGLTCFKIHY